jgi:hypothetical protein
MYIITPKIRKEEIVIQIMEMEKLVKISTNIKESDNSSTL